LGGDYQTARIVYANCQCAVFGFLGRTAKEAEGTNTRALKGFTSIECETVELPQPKKKGENGETQIWCQSNKLNRTSNDKIKKI
jgi:hypothetical protein